jgi:MFS family permease
MSNSSEPDAPERAYESGVFKNLTPNIVRMGLVSFLADVSSEMLYPLTPIFLTVVLGAPVAAVGLIEGVAESIASLLKSVSGRMSDRSGKRRPYITWGYGLAAVAKPLIGIAYGWPLVLLARSVDRFGKGLRTSPRDALLADSIDQEHRGLAFGWHRALDTMGAVLGPLLALGLLPVMHNNLRPIFAIAFIPGIIGAALTLTVRERRHVVKHEASSFRYRDLPARMKYYLLAWGVFSIANSSDVFLILKAKNVGFSNTLVILLYVVYNIVYASASPIFGRLSDRLGRKRVLVGGLLVFAGVYLGFAFARAAWMLWPLLAVYGLYIAATDGVGKALAVDLVTPEIRGTAVGILGTVTGVAALVASSVAGLLWTVIGPWAAFVYGSLGAIAGAILIARLSPRRDAIRPDGR